MRAGGCGNRSVNRKDQRIGHTPVPVNGNGRYKEAEEPVKPKGHRRKARALALSLFEWALEQERQPVGAGR